MRGWLLDTNIVSELRKPKPAKAVTEFVAAQPGELLFITEVTFGEIRYGIEQLEDSARRADINLWLDSTLRPLFSGRVLAITEDVVVRWKTMIVDGRKRGHTFGQPDLFIAAMAALEDLVVVTRDTPSSLPPACRHLILGRVCSMPGARNFKSLRRRRRKLLPRLS